MPKKSKGSEGLYPDIKNHTEQGMTEAEPATVIHEDDSSEFSEILYERMNLVVSGGQETIRLDKYFAEESTTGHRRRNGAGK
jgi:hypothetical protein